MPRIYPPGGSIARPEQRALLRLRVDRDEQTVEWQGLHADDHPRRGITLREIGCAGLADHRGIPRLEIDDVDRQLHYVLGLRPGDVQRPREIGERLPRLRGQVRPRDATRAVESHFPAHMYREARFHGVRETVDAGRRSRIDEAGPLGFRPYPLRPRSHPRRGASRPPHQSQPEHPAPSPHLTLPFTCRMVPQSYALDTRIVTRST